MSYGVDGDDERPTRRNPMRRHPTERMDSDGQSKSRSTRSGDIRAGDPVRSKVLYGGALGLAAGVLVAIGLAALFDISFWAALGITALIGLGLVMLLAVLVG
ncbi:MAG: hypothetical protein H0T54_05400 [Geodermatophilaceae bacterium]|nr:hypothetical protein [Geodermatophilaceae bacterium]